VCYTNRTLKRNFEYTGPIRKQKEEATSKLKFMEPGKTCSAMIFYSTGQKIWPGAWYFVYQFYISLHALLTNLANFSKHFIYDASNNSHQTVATAATTEVTGICTRCENGYKHGV